MWSLLPAPGRFCSSWPSSSAAPLGPPSHGSVRPAPLRSCSSARQCLPLAPRAPGLPIVAAAQCARCLRAPPVASPVHAAPAGSAAVRGQGRSGPCKPSSVARAPACPPVVTQVRHAPAGCPSPRHIREGGRGQGPPRPPGEAADVEQTCPSPELQGERAFGHLDEPLHFVVLQEGPQRGGGPGGPPQPGGRVRERGRSLWGGLAWAPLLPDPWGGFGMCSVADPCGDNVLPECLQNIV